MQEIETLKRWVAESRYTVFFGGAGVSTESGIPDFRSVDGLYHQKYDAPPETILSHSYFSRHPDRFFRFYREKMLYPDALPNGAHETLAEMEKQGRLQAVITQNIDGLHQKAGSKNVLELHGSVLRNYCTKCRRFAGLKEIMASEGIPRCRCGGILKPDVVLYEEALDQQTMYSAVDHIRRAELLIVGGTSLAVYPAAGLIDYYLGNRLVLINLAPTPYDHRADLLIAGKIGQVLSQIRGDGDA